VETYCGFPDQPHDQYLDADALLGAQRLGGVWGAGLAPMLVIAGLHAEPTAFVAERGIASMTGRSRHARTSERTGEVAA